MLLLASAATAGFLARAARSARDDRWPDWLTLAALFGAMAADEAASLHELLQKPIRAALGSESWLRYPLILPGLVVAIILALRFRRFMQTIGATRRRLVTGSAIFALGALVFEMIGGWFAPEARRQHDLRGADDDRRDAGDGRIHRGADRAAAPCGADRRNGLPMRDRSYSAGGVVERHAFEGDRFGRGGEVLPHRRRRQRAERKAEAPIVIQQPSMTG